MIYLVLSVACIGFIWAVGGLFSAAVTLIAAAVCAWLIARTEW